MQKHIIVTGANTGIGKATALELARQQQHVIMACRNEEKGQTVRNEIMTATGNHDVDLLLLD